MISGGYHLRCFQNVGIKYRWFTARVPVFASASVILRYMIVLRYQVLMPSEFPASRYEWS